MKSDNAMIYEIKNKYNRYNKSGITTNVNDSYTLSFKMKNFINNYDDLIKYLQLKYSRQQLSNKPIINKNFFKDIEGIFENTINLNESNSDFNNFYYNTEEYLKKISFNRITERFKETIDLPLDKSSILS